MLTAQHLELPKESGEKLLLAAIIRRAALDIALYKGSNRLEKRRIWKDAQRWILSNVDSHFTSFLSICNLLNQDPETLRKKVFKMKREDVRKYEMVVN